MFLINHTACNTLASDSEQCFSFNNRFDSFDSLCSCCEIRLLQSLPPSMPLYPPCRNNSQVWPPQHCCTNPSSGCNVGPGLQEIRCWRASHFSPVVPSWYYQQPRSSMSWNTWKTTSRNSSSAHNFPARAQLYFRACCTDHPIDRGKTFVGGGEELCSFPAFVLAQLVGWHQRFRHRIQWERGGVRVCVFARAREREQWGS